VITPTERAVPHLKELLQPGKVLRIVYKGFG
jgi:hypothetical protein